MAQYLKREPEVAENWESKSHLLSPNCYYTETSKYSRKSALKINKRVNQIKYYHNIYFFLIMN